MKVFHTFKIVQTGNKLRAKRLKYKHEGGYKSYEKALIQP